MGDNLTNQDKEFVKEIIETGNKTQSAMKAYGYKNENTAGVMALDKLRKPRIQKAIQDAIPDELLEEVHLQGLKATTGIGDNVQIDYSVRHKYLDTAYKLKGIYAPEKSINLNIDAEITNPKARELANEFEEKLKKSL